MSGLELRRLRRPMQVAPGPIGAREVGGVARRGAGATSTLEIRRVRRPMQTAPGPIGPREVWVVSLAVGLAR